MPDGNCGFYSIIKGLIKYFERNPREAEELEESGVCVYDLEPTWQGARRFRYSLWLFAKRLAPHLMSRDGPLRTATGDVNPNFAWRQEQ